MLARLCELYGCYPAHALIRIMNTAASTLLPLAIKGGQMVAQAVRQRRQRRAQQPVSIGYGGAKYYGPPGDNRQNRRARRRAVMRNVARVGVQMASAASPQVAAVANIARTSMYPSGDTPIMAVEQVQNLSATALSATFDLQVSEPIYPMSPTLCPRLRTIAAQYQKVIVTRFDIEYITALGTDNKGKVYIGLLPDVNSSVPTSIEEFGTIQGSVSGPLYSNLIFRSSTETTSAYSKALFIRDTDPEADNFATCGRLVVAVAGTGGTSDIGQLRVCYSLLCSSPRANEEVMTMSGTVLMDGDEPDFSPSCPLKIGSGEYNFRKRTRLACVAELLYVPGTVLPEITVSSGAVTSEHWSSAEEGLSMLVAHLPRGLIGVNLEMGDSTFRIMRVISHPMTVDWHDPESEAALHTWSLVKAKSAAPIASKSAAQPLKEGGF